MSRKLCSQKFSHVFRRKKIRCSHWKKAEIKKSNSKRIKENKNTGKCLKAVFVLRAWRNAAETLETSKRSKRRNAMFSTNWLVERTEPVEAAIQRILVVIVDDQQIPVEKVRGRDCVSPVENDEAVFLRQNVFTQLAKIFFIHARTRKFKSVANPMQDVC